MSIPLDNLFESSEVENNFYKLFNNKEEADNMINKMENDILEDPIKAGRDNYIKISGVSKNNGHISVNYVMDKYEEESRI